MSCDFIYQLKPLYEDKKRGGAGWYRLRWRPIKVGTWNLYTSKSFRHYHAIGFVIDNQGGAHNGWGRSWDRIDIKIHLYFFSIYFWIIFNILVHKDGPMDREPRKPLNLERLLNHAGR